MQQSIKFLATTAISFCSFFYFAEVKLSGSFQVSLSSQMALADNFRPDSVADRAYQSLSFVSKENNYVNNNTGRVDESNTLIQRFIKYHLYVKSRSVLSRFDWKLTLADYLGYNEPLLESRYPGYKYLKQNPIASDRRVINSLTVEQRALLVETLFNIYNPEGAKLLKTQLNFSITEEPQKAPNSQPTLRQSKPGDADLLKF